MNRIARWMWYPLALASIVILLAGLPAVLHGVPIGVTQDHLVYEPGTLYDTLRSLVMVTVLVSGALSVALAILIFRRRSQDRMGLFLSFYLLGYGVLLAGPIELLQPIWPAAPWVNSFVLLPVLTGPLTVYLFATFPDGRFVPYWSRWLVVLTILAIPGVLVYAPSRPLDLPFEVPLLAIIVLYGVSLLGFAGSIYAQVHRYRKVSGEVQRRQTKWVLYGLGLWLSVMAITGVGWVQALSLPQGSTAPWWLAFAELAWVLSTLFFPIALTIAMLRHGLLDIDILINRTLTYGVLTAGVVASYLAAIALVGVAIQTNRELAAALLTLLAAVALLGPLRARLQAVANRLVPTAQAPAGTAAAVRGTVVAGSIAVDASQAREPTRWKRSEPRVGAASTALKVHRLFRRLWPAAAVAGFAIFLAALPGYLAGLTTAPHSGGLQVEPGSLAYGFNVVSALLSIGAAGLSLALALLIYRRRGDDRMALFLSYYLLAHGVFVAGPVEAFEPFLPGIADFSITYLSPSIMGPPTIALLALFPDGRFVPAWTKPVTFGSLLFIPLSVLVGTPNLSDLGMIAMVGALYLLFFGTGGVMIYAQIHRHRHVSTTTQRQQTKWFVFGIAVWLAMAAVSSIPYMLLDSLPAGSPYPQWVPAVSGFWWLATAAIPISLTMAITRSRLYEIDVIINRTLVYGALTACVIALYALVVGGLGILFQSSGSVLVSLVATGLVAVLFQPLRERLQQGVNRLTYGASQDPVSVLTSLGHQLEETVSPQAALDSIVETVADHLKLPYAAIEFADRESLRTAASYGQRPEQAIDFPIIYQMERVGRLVVAPRTPQEALSRNDRILLENIARQAGATAKAAKLAADLQRSRQQLVAAREEERRRMRRDLHDGLGPQLASQTLALDALERRLAQDPAAAVELVHSLKDQSRVAMQDIRQLVYDLRPPALDELGLAGAIGEISAGQPREQLLFQIEADPELPPLPAAVEVAAYRIAQEAITNVVRHAGATNCRVELAVLAGEGQTQLLLTIEDDGSGAVPASGRGIGLSSMRERADELGGRLTVEAVAGRGTRVRAQLPFPNGESG